MWVSHRPATPRPGTYVCANSESTYDWEAEQWTAPLNVTYSQVLPIGKQLVSVGGGVRYYVDAPDDGPQWGLRLVFTLLYPK